MSQRNAAVDRAAQVVARFLGDTGNTGFYRYLLWQLLRLYVQGQDLFSRVYLQRYPAGGADRAEGFAFRTGALFISRLKASGVWDAIRNAPHYRVGSTPLAA